MPHKNIKLLSWFYFFLDFKLYSAVLVLYFSEVTGSFAFGMSIYSVIFLSQAILEVPTGIFSDMVGRKITFVLGMICSIFAVLSYGLANGYWILMLGGVLEGASRSFFSGTDEATLHDSLKEVGKDSEFLHHQGRISSMDQLGLGLSAALGGVVAYFTSYKLIIFLTLIPQTLALLTCLRFLEPKIFTRNESNVFSHLKTALREFRRNRKLRYLSLSDVYRFAIGESVFLFRPAFYALFWPVWAIGLAGTISYLVASLGFYFAGPVAKRFSAFKLLIGEVLLNRLINFTGLLFPSVLSPAIMTMTAIPYGPSHVALRTLMQKEFTDKQRATMGSLNSLLSNILFAIFAYGLGTLADQLGPSNGLLVLNILMLLVVVLYWKAFKSAV